MIKMPEAGSAPGIVRCKDCAFYLQTPPKIGPVPQVLGNCLKNPPTDMQGGWPRTSNEGGCSMGLSLSRLQESLERTDDVAELKKQIGDLEKARAFDNEVSEETINSLLREKEILKAQEKWATALAEELTFYRQAEQVAKEEQVPLVAEINRLHDELRSLKAQLTSEKDFSKWLQTENGNLRVEAIAQSKAIAYQTRIVRRLCEQLDREKGGDGSWAIHLGQKEGV